MANLSIENVINVSISTVGQGAGAYNTSNLAIFSHEAYETSFGTDGYKIYLEPSDVGVDFGTDSITYKKALAVFSQQPNILAGSGYLVVIPQVSEKQSLAFSGVPTSGSFILSYDGDDSVAINFDDTLSEVQTAVRGVVGLEDVVVTGSYAAGFVIEFFGQAGDIALVTTGTNSLDDGGAVTITVAEDSAGESVSEAVSRSESIIQYFGFMATSLLSEAEINACGVVANTLSKIGFFGSRTEADLDALGKFDNIRLAGLDKARCLFYGSDNDEDVYKFVASYAGRALSTNFNGSKTTQTMHLKDLAGIVPDPSMTQTLLTKAQSAGADCYISVQGVSKTFTSGENGFFDDVYNLLWFSGALKIAGFNVLAQTGTKIAQTENGVSSLKSAYRKICESAVTNEFVSAGSWNSPTTFGIQADFFDNISQRGYYIYSLPVALQLPSDRAARNAPLIQMAIKYAGSVHSSSVIVNINE